MFEHRSLKIAFYGKGGIGKSTIASNLSAAFSKLGLKVLHIGCDPKGDSTRNLVGKRMPAVLKVLQEKGNFIEEKDIIYNGFNGIACVEAGGPEAGVGCAGRGISTMVEELEYLGVFKRRWDIIVYDVLGDVVCGGFSVPMREKFVDVVFIVSSSEFMSLYAANNIIRSVNKLFNYKGNRFGGIIHNRRSEDSNNESMEYFAQISNTKVLENIPFCKEISYSELEGKTVIERFPQSEISGIFMNLAEKIVRNDICSIPKPLDDTEMEQLSRKLLEIRIKSLKG
ncbi:MAG: nitrogenase iron protein [Peptococcaceae bacterium]|jgi:nitrogenase iron protein NifH|nr:nitrogenase iron protein [Peptococcaceae bacterium]